MFIKRKKYECPKEFHHDPSIANKYGDTVAMIMAYNG